ncbi:HlyD family type I secretion periplasmic adaptor subunit [Limimaricola sp.]|uniref:HlyD family type I secretion periplasmic adaptor subunit n=1 Tax=Limimaricola sp. TaxID=2211665 RepID=UPI0025C2ADF7|nr:HlyD family type I secretion periplasmic adaptor subunit [Limimaricola sp.]
MTAAAPEIAMRRRGARGPVLAGLLTLVALALFLGVWGAFADLTGAVIAAGQIEVERNRLPVQNADGGVIAAVQTEEGQQVEAGDVLFEFDTETARSDLASIEGRLFEIMARRARYEAEQDGADTLTFDPVLTSSSNPVAATLMDGQRRLFDARRTAQANEAEQLARQREQVGAQIRGLQAQAAGAAAQIALLDTQITSQQDLRDRGLAQAATLTALQRQRADLAGQQGAIAAAIAEAQGRDAGLALAALKLGDDRREQAISQLRDLGPAESDLVQKRAQLIRQIDRATVRAPVAGTVYGLVATAPQTLVRPGETLLYLVPRDRPLEITARIAPRDIDQVHPGQEVLLRLTAFDQRRTPEVAGTITRVSADTFRDQPGGPSYYRATVALDPGAAKTLPEGLRLIPGMPVEVQVRGASRTLFDYFLKPLGDFFAHAFRET